MRSGSGGGFKRLREMRPVLCALVCLGLKACERQQGKKKRGEHKDTGLQSRGKERERRALGEDEIIWSITHL